MLVLSTSRRAQGYGPPNPSVSCPDNQIDRTHAIGIILIDARAIWRQRDVTVTYMDGVAS